MEQVLPDKVQVRDAAEDAAWVKAADRDEREDSVPGLAEHVFARSAAGQFPMNAGDHAIKSIALIAASP